MLTLALILPALADADLAPCAGFFAYDSIPRPAAVEVPIDVVPTVLFGDGGCPDTTTFHLDLYRIDDGVETLIGSQASMLAGSGPILVGFETWTGAPSLAANASYILRVGPQDGGGELSEIAFSTGSATLEEVQGAPTLSVDSADANRSGGTWWISVGLFVAPAADPSGLSIVVVPHPDAPDQLLDAQVVGDEAELFSSVGWLADRAPDEVCLSATQLDGALREVGESEPFCVAPEIHRNVGSSGRCDTGALGLGLLPALLGALATRRRRG